MNKPASPFVRYIKGEHTPEVFNLMCKQHDLHYAKSSDMRVWRAGHAQMQCIMLAMEDLGQAKTIPVWNCHIKHKVAESMQDSYLWHKIKEPT